ncbi:MAG: UTP--glucose-1-phosphate uridylyltransferase [Candidatus Levybacteria bacterium CG_4_10_14_0_2_um_filter_36_16]|nr:MAG: UTP--glucose-1-phosphate uridylyltransferase [Candidatus Levybacteria bacterium CG2_30_37_29]PIR79618.1 MAG: UTP--glucose-1-phosphate uridylyltransferase [Candidatus Levybacteria bacterium CG10_big_fil_rev_8_21_14_0_10_36_30]PIZ97421.1 MAG: UTP--glucose-1-phosphate uridylyltransferase [Candidatus Levybacteria bacterium CG_4_10_14_0_2_um_filter_36_16]PJA89999.1 MAG: UTP--glucose-1-phosphate uridylyltransferase [Candidatus Levybacteria bacterium CG_4_9_14_3_um_filter_36_7]
MTKIRKAVIPAAGFGTRFLPQTKAMPKEMLPIVDKPIVQYIVEELVNAGIEDIIIVTGSHKRTIEDHFDSPSMELVENLRMGGEKKMKFLEEAERIASMANFIYVRQKGPYGNGTPLLNVKSLIGNEPFIYTWSDDFIKARPKSRFQQMIEVYEKYGCSVLASVKAKSDEDYDRYGFAGGEEIEDGLIDAKTIIEKPGKQNAPSDLATVSGFIFTPDIFQYLDGALNNLREGDELYYNDALKLMLNDKKRVLAYEIKGGKYYDTGNKLEYMKTVVELALEHPDVKEEFKKFLKDLNL